MSKSIGLYYQGDDSEMKPTLFCSLEEAREWKQLGMGVFINRGKAFRRTDEMRPQDHATYCPGRVCKDSLLANQPVMERYAAGQFAARAAIDFGYGPYQAAR